MTYGTESSLDLSNCSALKTINFYGVKINVTLPPNVTYFYNQSGIWPDFTNCANKIVTLSSQYHDGSDSSSDFANACKQLSTSSSLQSINFYPYARDYDFSGIKYLSKSNISNISIKRANGATGGTVNGLKNIDLRKPDDYVEGTPHFNNLKTITFDYATFENLDSFKDCLALENISITNTSTLSDISGLEKLVELKTVNFENDMKITNLYSLRNCSKLESLNLNNNSIYNTVYDTATGTTVNNIEIIKNLNSQKLKKLYLLNNRIDDFSELEKLTFTEKKW